MKPPQDCGVLILHGSEGYACGRLGSEACSDCGTTLCDPHADACELCLQVFCDCCLYFHSKEPHVMKTISLRFWKSPRDDLRSRQAFDLTGLLYQVEC